MTAEEQVFITTLQLATDRDNSELDVKAALLQAAGLFAIAVALNRLINIAELVVRSVEDDATPS